MWNFHLVSKRLIESRVFCCITNHQSRELAKSATTRQLWGWMIRKSKGQTSGTWDNVLSLGMFWHQVQHTLEVLKLETSKFPDTAGSSCTGGCASGSISILQTGWISSCQHQTKDRAFIGYCKVQVTLQNHLVVGIYLHSNSGFFRTMESKQLSALHFSSELILWTQEASLCISLHSKIFANFAIYLNLNINNLTQCAVDDLFFISKKCTNIALPRLPAQASCVVQAALPVNVVSNVVQRVFLEALGPPWQNRWLPSTHKEMHQDWKKDPTIGEKTANTIQRRMTQPQKIPPWRNHFFSKTKTRFNPKNGHFLKVA